MADRTKPRTWRGLALILTMALLLVTGCQSDKDSSSSHGSGGAAAAVVSDPTTAKSQGGSDSTEKLCGTPPCVRYVSRSETKTLSETLTDHPVASTVVLHIALSALCGGILCLLGEGVSLPILAHKANDAAAQHACLKVGILPDKDKKWQLVDITASNQKPNCTD
ncbi:MAG: hypothetical protein AUG49_08140 [Catenulispora sp. 13_1_20CM_3_70_7]|nr:hypothetical protein [Catenulisporales bacterium]OLE26441.1 MAG: hypothetical protein AUG49_08140 [Catenulispora sp. 13_1_20CM_3_70_7]